MSQTLEFGSDGFTRLDVNGEEQDTVLRLFNGDTERYEFRNLQNGRGDIIYAAPDGTGHPIISFAVTNGNVSLTLHGTVDSMNVNNLTVLGSLTLPNLTSGSGESLGVDSSQQVINI